MYPIWLQICVVLYILNVVVEFICNLLSIIQNYVRSLCWACAAGWHILPFCFLFGVDCRFLGQSHRGWHRFDSTPCIWLLNILHPNIFFSSADCYEYTYNGHWVAVAAVAAVTAPAAPPAADANRMLGFVWFAYVMSTANIQHHQFKRKILFFFSDSIKRTSLVPSMLMMMIRCRVYLPWKVQIEKLSFFL